MYSNVKTILLLIIKLPEKSIHDVVEFEEKWPMCWEIYKIYAKLTLDLQIDVDFKIKKKGFIPFTKDTKISSCIYTLMYNSINISSHQWLSYVNLWLWGLIYPFQYYYRMVLYMIEVEVEVEYWSFVELLGIPLYVMFRGHYP